MVEQMGWSGGGTTASKANGKLAAPRCNGQAGAACCQQAVTGLAITTAWQMPLQQRLQALASEWSHAWLCLPRRRCRCCRWPPLAPLALQLEPHGSSCH
jgi:hypothetical protein